MGTNRTYSQIVRQNSRDKKWGKNQARKFLELEKGEKQFLIRTPENKAPSSNLDFIQKYLDQTYNCRQYTCIVLSPKCVVIFQS